jgi:alkanesulfonate monooxygenase SsuD/methylene tetrahydromethanopterin reductase-like flavin-dependent oxidoreductase (luciferase family)
MTDETLTAFRTLLTEDTASFHGAHWRFDDVSIKPRPSWEIPILVAGGSRMADAGSSHDRPRMTRPVLERIMRWDGWLAPCAGDEAMTMRDLASVRRAFETRGRSESSYRLAHVQWTYVVDTGDRDAALSEQLPAFRRLMGQHHTKEHLVQTYLLGSRQDIVDRVRRLRNAGFHEIIVGPVVSSKEQAALIAEVIGEAARDD